MADETIVQNVPAPADNPAFLTSFDTWSIYKAFPA